MPTPGLEEPISMRFERCGVRYIFFGLLSAPLLGTFFVDLPAQSRFGLGHGVFACSFANSHSGMEISGQKFGAADIEERFEQGAVTFARWFAKLMDANGWSHPKLVELAKVATDGKSWVHSSQIASLRIGKLKSPGPRSFASLSYLWSEIDAYQNQT